MKKGIKRLCFILMWIAVPFVSAEPISLMQETPLYRPTLTQAITPEPVQKIKIKRLREFYGTASWYSESDPNINRHTANGEVFDDSKLTCASWDFAFGSYLKVKNLANGKSVVCRVNDRGPAKRLERLIDLTKTSFSRIASPKKGLIRVSVTPLNRQKK
jgi:rare lipoprotein A